MTDLRAPQPPLPREHHGATPRNPHPSPKNPQRAQSGFQRQIASYTQYPRRRQWWYQRYSASAAAEADDRSDFGSGSRTRLLGNHHRLLRAEPHDEFLTPDLGLGQDPIL